MGIFDVGAGTSIGFSGNLGDAKNIWRQNQATLQAARKAAADKAAKDDEKAAATVNDFVLKDPNKYTEKYQPIAMQAKVDLMNKVIEAKRANPNNWTNMITPLVLEAQDKVNFALEQSNVQRDIQKKAAEGYMVPKPLLDAYNTNYGNTDDLIKNAEALKAYGVIVDPKTGSVGGNVFKQPDESSFYKFVPQDYNSTVSTDGRVDPKTGQFKEVTTTTVKPERFAGTQADILADPAMRTYLRTQTPEYTAALAQGKSDEEALKIAALTRSGKYIKPTTSESYKSAPKAMVINNFPTPKETPIEKPQGSIDLSPADSPVTMDKYGNKTMETILNDKTITPIKDGSQTVYSKNVNGVDFKVIVDEQGNKQLVKTTQQPSRQVSLYRVWQSDASALNALRSNVVLTEGAKIYKYGSHEKVNYNDLESANLSPVSFGEFIVNGKKELYGVYGKESSGGVVDPNDTYLVKIEKDSRQDREIANTFSSAKRKYKDAEDVLNDQVTRGTGKTVKTVTKSETSVPKVDPEFRP